MSLFNAASTLRFSFLYEFSLHKKSYIIISWVLWFLVGYLSHRTDSENHIWLQLMLMLNGLLAPTFTALFLYLKNPILLQDLKNKFFHFEKKTAKIGRASCRERV